jgi:hypothetical protein
VTLVKACGRRRVTIRRERSRVRLDVPDRVADLTPSAARQVADTLRFEAQQIQPLPTRCSKTHPHHAARCNTLSTPARARCCTAEVVRC